MNIFFSFYLFFLRYRKFYIFYLDVHLAGVNPEIYSGFKANEVYKKNIEIHKKTIDLIFRKKIQKVIFFSSFSVYQKTKLINENSIISKKKFYARSKIFMEQKLLNMNISSYILRLGAILGKNSSNNWLSSVRDRVKENNDITFYNPESTYNNCIYVDDVCLSIEKILKRNIFERKIYNLSSNKPIQIRKIINILKNNKSYKGNIYIRKKNDVFFNNNSQKIQKELNLKFYNTIDVIGKIFKKDIREKTILFGSNGYIGSFLKDELKEHYNIFPVHRNNLNNFMLNKDKLFKDLTKINIIYLILNNKKKEFIKENIKILNKVIKNFSKYKINNFILLSSTHSHNYEYLKLNKLREKIVEKKYKNNHFILCPGKVFGYKTIKSNYGINSILNDIKKNNIKIFGNGKNYCPHTYINDLKNLIFLFLKSNFKSGKYYLYDKKKISFIEIANKIIKYSSNNNKIKITHTGKGLEYKIKKPYIFKSKMFKYSNINQNIKKILNERV